VALKGIGGSLASGDLLDELASGGPAPAAMRQALAEARRSLGPASTARQIFDLQLAPLMAALGVDLTIVRSGPAEVVAAFGRGTVRAGLLAAGGWGTDLRRLRERVGRDGRWRPRWWMGGNGTTARLVDS
jgi:hypothetical protein